MSEQIMRDIHSLYRVEEGRVLIELKLSSVMQIFNSFDPAPFQEKELDKSAETFIVNSVNDFPLKTRFKIVIYLPDVIKDTKDARDIPEAIRTHFEHRSLNQKRQFRQRVRYGEYALIVGLSFLAIATTVSAAINLYLGSYPFAHVIASVLEITGWVAMWEPVMVFLYQLWPIVRQRKVYDKIRGMEIDIHSYHKISK